ncbi:MAG: transposase [Candidatus Melainabacteria bacterium HGW-Melainabacteria-1]|nr:MAG: transposase [Candidatus Melainabacteria bacterium HGW-Melainabacteria-1]
MPKRKQSKPLKTFKYKAKVSKTTAAHAEHWLWKCRQLYNLALEQRIEAFRRCGVSLSTFDQNNELPDFKKTFPEFAAVGSQVLQNVIARLDRAYDSFFDRLKAGKGKAGFPRFKSADRYHSFTLSQSGWKLDGRYLKITGIGIFKLHLSRPIAGRIKTITVKRDSCGDWWVTFACEDVPPRSWEQPAKEKVGIDVGLKHFCVDSDPDSQPIANPKFYHQAQAKLRRQQRKQARRQKGSKRRKKARVLTAKSHRRIRDLRLDFLHKTSTAYVERYREIHVEDLKVANMVKNRHLSKAISDAGWSTFFELLTYKAADAGRKLIKVNPRGTSQKCSNPKCGEIVPKTLAERIHSCKHCGLSICRDKNASNNIEQAEPAIRAGQALANTIRPGQGLQTLTERVAATVV